MSGVQKSSESSYAALLLDEQIIRDWRKFAWDHRDETDSARIVMLADALLALKTEAVETLRRKA